MEAFTIELEPAKLVVRGLKCDYDGGIYRQAF
jgi:hypothetical protein